MLCFRETALCMRRLREEVYLLSFTKSSQEVRVREVTQSILPSERLYLQNETQVDAKDPPEEKSRNGRFITDVLM